MATRKKKIVEDPANDIPIMTDAKSVMKKKTKEVKGSHLTITYDANNYPVKLEWDDEALLRDVRAAILKAESNIPASTEKKPAVKAKITAARKTKNVRSTSKS